MATEKVTFKAKGNFSIVQGPYSISDTSGIHEVGTVFDIPVFQTKSFEAVEINYQDIKVAMEKAAAAFNEFSLELQDISISMLPKKIQGMPGMLAKVKHPVTQRSGLLSTVIQQLNDYDKWTREEIADWLETLDLDLRFQTEYNGTTDDALGQDKEIL